MVDLGIFFRVDLVLRIDLIFRGGALTPKETMFSASSHFPKVYEHNTTETQTEGTNTHTHEVLK